MCISIIIKAIIYVYFYNNKSYNICVFLFTDQLASSFGVFLLNFILFVIEFNKYFPS